MILKLSNKENTYTFTVDDLNNGEKLYFKFQIPASDVVDGKYNMVLMDDDGNIITEEQVCMGYFNAETIQYNRGENVYINAPLNANIEDVQTITIDVPSYTIYPSDGYDAMKEVVVDAQPVYDNGYNEGEIAQKAKLTGITITENGTYSREDGYNEITVDVPDLNGDYNEGYDAGKVDGYDSGYTAGIDYASENAGEIAAANAIDLVATKIGTYYTKYSDNIDIVYPDLVTGIYPNGENFYDYVNLTSSVYNTGIIPTKDCKIEFWHKYTNSQSDTKWKIFIGSGKEESGNNYQLRRELGTASFWVNWGDKYVFPDIVYGEWNHIVVSYSDGVVVNGVKLSGVDMPQNDGNSPFYINGAEYSLSTNINGYFGMIKITAGGVENVIIPTEDGFKNITTGEMLEMVNDGAYAFVNNTPNTNILDNLIKSVDVQAKIDVGRYGIKFANSTFSEVPPYFNFNNLSDCSGLFSNCTSLETTPLLGTGSVGNMQGMFATCPKIKTIKPMDCRNVTNMAEMFLDDDLEALPELNTKSVTTMNGFLRKYGGMQKLTSLPKFNVPKLTDIKRFFYLNQVTMNNLTEVGGWENLNCNWNDGGGLVCLPNLTYQSCINVLNGLADVTELGGRTLKVHPNFLTTVGDEINIGINKGWTITA